MHVCIALYSMMHTYFFSHSAYRVKHFHLGTEFKWKKILQGSKNDNWGLGMKENNSDQMLKRKYHKVDHNDSANAAKLEMKSTHAYLDHSSYRPLTD